MKNETMNLCNTCQDSFATCTSNIQFGTGLGNDNIIKCDIYNKKQHLDEKGFCPNCGSYTFVNLDCGEIQCCKCFEVYNK